MKSLVVLTLLSLVSLTWAASVPLDLTNQNKDSRLVWNIFIPEETAVGFRQARQIEMTDLLPSDKEGEESDIYWRTWNGTIPKDALVGAYGKTECGSNVPIYMAQVFHKGESESGILPAQMFKKSKSVTVSFARKEYKYKKNIKVLCAENPSILTWVPIEETKDLNITADEDCVIAGNELTFNIYFGRTEYDDETIIGKAVFHSKTMYFPYYGEEKYLTENYEILCYRKAIETRKTEATKKQSEEKKPEETKTTDAPTESFD